MPSIYPVPTNRTTDLLAQTRLITQLQRDQVDIQRLQSQISTGRRIILPSEDSAAAARAMSLQRLLELKGQAKVNLTTSQSYLDATDVAISSVSGLLTQMKALGVSAAQSTNSATTLAAASAEIERAINQLMDIGNQNFRGRYLFGGARTTQPPFGSVQDFVSFSGNSAELLSFADVDQLLPSNIAANDLFGAYSPGVTGSVDLNPITTRDTKLVDLRRGLGITAGSISLSAGSTTRIIDLSSAETLGDVADLIEAGAPPGRTIRARVTPVGLEINLADGMPGNLTIQEVGAGTTAAELGILNKLGVGTGTIVGGNLDPTLRRTTKLSDILGARALGVLESVGQDNDIVLEARDRGAAANGVAVQFVDDRRMHASPGLIAGSETVTYSDVPVAARAAVTFNGFNNNLLLTAAQPGLGFNNVSIQIANAGAIGNAATVGYNSVTKVLTIGVDSGNATQVQTIIDAINAEGTFTAAYDASDPADGGFVATATINSADAGIVSGNTSNSGGNARTAFVYIEPGATVAQEVVTALQANATINGMFDVRVDEQDVPFGTTTGQGIVDVNSRALTKFGGGEEFDQTAGLQINNGGQTYTIDVSSAQTVEDLLNSINGSSANALAEINDSGNGLRIRSRLSGADFTIGENGGRTATQLGLRSLDADTQLADLNYGAGVNGIDGVDFTIRRNDGVDLGIDISSARTLGDVVNLINNHPANLDPNTRVVARLAQFGNGIELIDDNPQAGGSLTVVPAFGSDAAWQLGLTAKGATQSSPASTAAAATASLAFPPPNHLNTAIRLTANQAGTSLNGVEVVFQNTAVGDTASATYDSVTKQLVVSLDTTQTTANTILAAIQTEGTFAAALDTSADPTNDGTGVVGVAGTIASTAGGTAHVLKGSDTNPLEVSGVFNTLLRLKKAVNDFDLPGMERALGLLETDAERVNFGRADLGARGHAFDLLKNRIDDEEVQLKATLSQEIDVDFVQSVSDLTARQAALEATLRLSGQTLKMTLLDFL